MVIKQVENLHPDQGLYYNRRMASVLVAGGAGYIGSHVVRWLLKNGHSPIVFDNLSTGHESSIPEGVPLVQGDIRYIPDLKRVFEQHEIDAVMHFCAKSIVGESMEVPELYFDNNVVGGLNMLNVMREFNIDVLIFSSTAAVFGEPAEVPISEQTPMLPTNCYGETKLIFERILKWYDQIHGVRHIALRYFNAAGADPEGVIGEDHQPETHLIPILFEVLNGQRETVTVFGHDYPTRDGTCVRDYIHVYDLAEAHVLALEHLLDGHPSNTFNLGSGEGYTVQELITTTEHVVGRPIKTIMGGRRAGDPSTLIAASQKIQTLLGWSPQYTLTDIISSAANWHLAHPTGYSS